VYILRYNRYGDIECHGSGVRTGGVQCSWYNTLSTVASEAQVVELVKDFIRTGSRFYR
jgi:hypothetical protein